MSPSVTVGFWVIGAALALSLLNPFGSKAAHAREFTLSDMLEWSYASPVLDGRDYRAFENWSLFSPDPDREHFAVRTTQGDLRRGVVRDRLLIFDTREIERYIGSREINVLPVPISIIEREAVSERNAISYVQWLNPGEIAFVGQGGDGTNQAFLVDIRTGALTQLTHHDTDVTSFALAGDRLVYFARVKEERPVAVAATDDTWLGSLLAPSNEGHFPKVELFAATRSRLGVTRLLTSAVKLKINFQKIWIAPNGRYAVTRLPAVDWPFYWREYQLPECDFWCFTPDRRSSDPMSAQLQLRHRYVLIDLKDLKVKPLLDAPTGLLSGNHTPPEVFWPKEGKSVIVSGTFLPLKTGDAVSRAQRATGPAVAEVEIDSGIAREIFLEPHAGSGERIYSLRWSNNPEQLIVSRQQKDGLLRYDGYRKFKNIWIGRGRGAPDPAVSFTVSVVESLNEPPQMVVVGGKCNCEKSLLKLNPNADKFSFGLMSVREWSDSENTVWRGGLLLPPKYVAGQKYPLIVQTHGFSSERFLLDGPDDFHTAFAAQVFAGAGFAVLQIEDKSSLDNTKREAQSYAEGYRAGIDDLVNAGIADPARVGIIAFSRTGMGTLDLLTRFPSKVSAAIMADAFVDGYLAQLNGVNLAPDMRAQWAASGVSSPFVQPFTQWWMATPVSKLPQTKVPVMVQAMTANSTVASWEVYAALRGYGIPTDFLYIPNGSHILFNPQERLASQGRSLDWFRFWLQDEKDSSAGKQAQYESWCADRKKQEGRLAVEVSSGGEQDNYGVPATHESRRFSSSCRSR